MFYYVYIIESKVEKRLYAGRTKNLQQRLKEHNQKLNQSTRMGTPWKYIYVEACLNPRDAERREGYLKTTQGRRMLKRRLKEYFDTKN